MLRALILITFAACSSPAPVGQTPAGPPQEQPIPPNPTAPDPKPQPTPDPTPPEPTPPVPTAAKADGAACLEATECASGTCEGQGCGADQPGTCAPKTRGCTRDLRPYCGCDGQTFRTSGSCPGKRFSARAACP